MTFTRAMISMGDTNTTISRLVPIVGGHSINQNDTQMEQDMLMLELQPLTTMTKNANMEPFRTLHIHEKI
jgi:hypothetical protein